MLLTNSARRQVARLRFRNSTDYWRHRYRSGGDSGGGSYGRLARFKADVLNGFVREHDVQSVLGLGCGDGAQLSLADYPAYTGFDVSPQCVDACRARFPQWRFVTDLGTVQSHDLTLSLDVIYHLVEDDTYRRHMVDLFRLARSWVIIYASNTDRAGRSLHVRHRRFTGDIPDGWALAEHIQNRYPAPVGQETADSSFADFWIYRPR